MERSGAHEGKRRPGGQLPTAENELMVLYSQMLARRSLPGRYAAPAVTFRLVRGVSLSGDWGSPTSAAGQPHSADALFGD
jgi:hypothetical protein